MSKKLQDLKWESVPLEGFPASLGNNLMEFVGLEECTDYTLDKDKPLSKKKKREKKRKNPKTIEESTEKPVPNKKTKLSNGFIVETCNSSAPSLSNEDTSSTDHNVGKKKKQPKTIRRLGSNVSEVNSDLTPQDMLSWAEFKLPEEIMRALMELGFKQPTKIQQLTLPAAIHGRRDILGAAETGSGKTLAFGLPILTGIMKIKEKALAKGLDVYDILYKKSSTKKKTEPPKNVKPVKKKKGKKAEIEAKESSEDGYSSGEDSENKEENEDKHDDDQFIEEIEVPIKAVSADEGNDSDDSADYVHLSDIFNGDDDDKSEDDEDNEQSDEENEKSEDNDDAKNDETDEETDSQEELHENEEGIGCVKVIDNIALPGPERASSPLYALILTPTRELAMQVSQHLKAVAKYTGLRIATLVGGMASVKQERELRRAPELVVATPGRLWELAARGEPHLQRLDAVKFLAIDETDRMVERGHFEELYPLLERLNADERARAGRQNFVFSATLTLVHELPSHMRGKKVTKRGKIISRRVEKMTAAQKVRRLVQLVGMTEPKVVDITTQNLGTADTLTECKIACAFEQKDEYLYYILKRHPGRTIVFCNAIGCVKRLAKLLSILQCNPLPLHAGMPQRQRLKNLERFRDDARGVLVATDVAARGLDVPGVRHVVHYQVPRTAENYVHRSGRTARAHSEGLTILMMEPQEAYRYSKLCLTLNKKSDLPSFPVGGAALAGTRAAVRAARELDALELRRRRAAAARGWRERAARECDLIVDEQDAPMEAVDPGLERAISLQRRQLAALLARPAPPRACSLRHPALAEPPPAEEDALQVMKKAIQSGELKRQKRKSKNAPLLMLQKTLRKK